MEDPLDDEISRVRPLEFALDLHSKLLGGNELLREPELAVILFRRTGWDAADYQAWSDRLLADQVAFVTPSAWEGETVGRLVFLHPHTSIDLVQTVIDAMA